MFIRVTDHTRVCFFFRFEFLLTETTSTSFTGNQRMSFQIKYKLRPNISRSFKRTGQQRSISAYKTSHRRLFSWRVEFRVWVSLHNTTAYYNIGSRVMETDIETLRISEMVSFSIFFSSPS